jgi:hypothetical protein
MRRPDGERPPPCSSGPVAGLPPPGLTSVLVERGRAARRPPMAVTDGGCGPHIRRYGLTIRDRSGFVLPTSGEKARGDARP